MRVLFRYCERGHAMVVVGLGPGGEDRAPGYLRARGDAWELLDLGTGSPEPPPGIPSDIAADMQRAAADALSAEDRGP